MVENDNASWVTTELAKVKSGDFVWRVTKIHHLSGAENSGKRNVFLYLHRDGQQVYSGVSIRWGWKDQHADEQQPPKQLDKKPPDPSTDIPIDKGQHIWVEVLDPAGYPSDKVSNLHSDLPSDGEGNSEWHQSYAVTYELQVNDVVVPPIVLPDQPVTPTDPGDTSWQQRVIQLEVDMKMVKEYVGLKG